MYKYDRNQLIELYRSGLALRGRIEEIVDDVWQKGIKNICWLGIGGTWASAMQAVVHMRERSSLEVFAENAGEYLVTGNRRIGDGTLVIFSSVTGTTKEIVEAVQRVRQQGAIVFGFIDNADAPLVQDVDYCISCPKNEQLKFFMAADRLMLREGVFPDYDAYYAQLDAHLAEDLAEVEFKADAFAEAFVKAHKDDYLTYFVGAGALYGATYSYAMCYWEEMHWIRTKSIHSAEFFHGMLEIIEEDTPVTLFIGEDAQRSLGERVARFLPKVCQNYTVIDTQEYALPGIDDAFRPVVCHLVMHAVTNRIDAHLEALSGHDMKLRRYYRKMDY